MKIVLLMPQSDRYGQGGAFSQELRYAPLTLTTLAALVPLELNAEIVLIDEWQQQFDPHMIEADIVAITVITGNAPKSYQYSRVLRKRGIAVVLGGIHITMCPEEAIHHASAIVLGYAEESWPQLLRDFHCGKMERSYDQQPTTLDGYPWPRRDLLPTNGFATNNVVQATRGCIHKCTFCVVPNAWPQKYQRNVDDVAAETASLPGDRFILIDLSPTDDQEYYGRLCDAFASVGKYWGGLATIDVTQNSSLMKRMERSHCKGLLVGIESQNPTTLKSMGKRWHQSVDYAEAIKVFHDHGIAVNGCFVFGMDGDTERVFDETLEFVFKTGIDLPRFAIATPFPGTPFFRQMEIQQRLLTKNWVFYDGQHVVFQPKAPMDPQTLYDGTKYCWHEAYSLSGVMKRLWTSTAVSLSPRKFVTAAVAASTNFGYLKYARAYPKWMPIPCEGRQWFDPANAQHEVMEVL